MNTVFHVWSIVLWIYAYEKRLLFAGKEPTSFSVETVKLGSIETPRRHPPCQQPFLSLHRKAQTHPLRFLLFLKRQFSSHHLANQIQALPLLLLR